MVIRLLYKFRWMPTNWWLTFRGFSSIFRETLAIFLFIFMRTPYICVFKKMFVKFAFIHLVNMLPWYYYPFLNQCNLLVQKLLRTCPTWIFSIKMTSCSCWVKWYGPTLVAIFETILLAKYNSLNGKVQMGIYALTNQ